MSLFFISYSIYIFSMRKLITRIGEPFTLRGRTYICNPTPTPETFISCIECIFYKERRFLNGKITSPCSLEVYYDKIVRKCCGSGGVYESYN